MIFTFHIHLNAWWSWSYDSTDISNTQIYQLINVFPRRLIQVSQTFAIFAEDLHLGGRNKSRYTLQAQRSGFWDTFFNVGITDITLQKKTPAAKRRKKGTLFDHHVRLNTKLPNAKSSASELPIPDPSISSIWVPQRAEAATFGRQFESETRKMMPT